MSVQTASGITCPVDQRNHLSIAWEGPAQIRMEKDTRNNFRSEVSTSQSVRANRPQQHRPVLRAGCYLLSVSQRHLSRAQGVIG